MNSNSCMICEHRNRIHSSNPEEVQKGLAWCAGCVAFNRQGRETNLISLDSNVEAIRTKLLQRSQVGLEKYGVTTERDDLDLPAWLTHLQEELLDGAVYIEAALRRMR